MPKRVGLLRDVRQASVTTIPPFTGSRMNLAIYKIVAGGKAFQHGRKIARIVSSPYADIQYVCAMKLNTFTIELCPRRVDKSATTWTLVIESGQDIVWIERFVQGVVNNFKLAFENLRHDTPLKCVYVPVDEWLLAGANEELSKVEMKLARASRGVMWKLVNTNTNLAKPVLSRHATTIQRGWRKYRKHRSHQTARDTCTNRGCGHFDVKLLTVDDVAPEFIKPDW